MKKKYIKPEIVKLVVMPHFNLLITSELNIFDGENDETVNEDDYDSLL